MTAFENTYNSITTFSSAEKLACLNQVVENWRGLFEEPPHTDLRFSVNEKNILCFGDVEICDIADVNATSSCCDFEAFYFESVNKGYYRILITWDFDDNIYVRETSLVLYDGSDDEA